MEPQRKEYRSACVGLDRYDEDNGQEYCVLHFPGENKKYAFEKALESKLVRNDYIFNATIFPKGTSDTVFRNHDFGANPVSFRDASFAGNTNFTHAIFGGSLVDFSDTKFGGGITSFDSAQFGSSIVWFNRTEFNSVLMTSFSSAQFSGRDTLFSSARFCSNATYFTDTNFSGHRTGFIHARFSSEQTFFTKTQFRGNWTSFRDAHFDSAETGFENATFAKEVIFTAATFKNKVTFWGHSANTVFDSRAKVRFDRSQIDKPELLIFNTVLLRPSWFINTDVRKVNFTDVKWYGLPGGPQGTLGDEIDALEQWGYVESPHTLLAQTCRRLSASAEENREYPLSNEFHYWSMDALRRASRASRKERWDYRKETWDGLAWIRQNWLRVARRCGLATTLRLVWGRIGRRYLSRPKSIGLITTLYWASSGYGVRAARAFWVLAIMWLVFAAIYLLLTPSPFWVFSASDIWQGLDHVREAAVYSLSALVRLNPRPQSEGLDWFQTLVTVEGILGPIQIALLALAVRRKVMR